MTWNTSNLEDSNYDLLWKQDTDLDVSDRDLLSTWTYLHNLRWSSKTGSSDQDTTYHRSGPQ